MKIEPTDSIDEIEQILATCDLPTQDIASSACARFFGIFDEATLVAVVGLELYGKVGLLRSLAVLPSHQCVGLGNKLVQHAESVAMQQGVEQLYLLTTTAESYFQRLGYDPVPRCEAPELIRTTAQFSELCPASSAFLSKVFKK